MIIWSQKCTLRLKNTLRAGAGGLAEQVAEPREPLRGQVNHLDSLISEELIYLVQGKRFLIILY